MQTQAAPKLDLSEVRRATKHHFRSLDDFDIHRDGARYKINCGYYWGEAETLWDAVLVRMQAERDEDVSTHTVPRLIECVPPDPEWDCPH